MHAVFSVVDLDPGRQDAAIEMLNNDMIPGLKQAPGFVSGIWFGDGSVGHGVVVFETEEQAQQVQQMVNSTVMDGVRVTRSDLYKVDAHA